MAGALAAVDVQDLAGDELGGLQIGDRFDDIADIAKLAARRAGDRPLDVFIAGDDAGAKARVSSFADSVAPCPLEAGFLRMARWLEGAGLLEMRLAIGGAVKDSNFSLAINVLG